MGLPPVRTLDDIVAVGKEVREKGYTALKTNVLLLGGDNPHGHTPGFARGGSFPELNPERYVIDAIRDQLAAFREGAGQDVDILVDLNFNYKTEGFLRLARAMEPFDLAWVEIDTRDPDALAHIRTQTRIPVASLETLSGRGEFRPFLERGAVDVAIVDVPWNGLGESLKIAALAEAHEVNVAPHNYYSHLATLMAAHFAAIVPNLRIVETDPDMVPWQDELITAAPDIRDGHLHLPSGPGWGAEVDEDAVRAHPPQAAR
jgi:L-alanine-DL-glutamate epimerase-like enolase superfamily enzyme